MLKTILLSVLVTLPMSGFAFTQAEAVRAAFNNDKFVDAIGADKIESISVTGKLYEFSVVVNEKAPLSDGCSVEAKISTERFAQDRITTSIRLVVADVTENCGW